VGRQRSLDPAHPARRLKESTYAPGVITTRRLEAAPEVSPTFTVAVLRLVGILADAGSTHRGWRPDRGRARVESPDRGAELLQKLQHNRRLSVDRLLAESF
jgi:hypothetical protein